mmetsp:Transcript_95455/g.269900  ORF Transcript_95455/g.269900 Transcript_95455/m.269900 type:complete len:221 (-) Transcript_95455:1009-1671(-)
MEEGGDSVAAAACNPPIASNDSGTTSKVPNNRTTRCEPSSGPIPLPRLCKQRNVAESTANRTKVAAYGTLKSSFASSGYIVQVPKIDTHAMSHGASAWRRLKGAKANSRLFSWTWKEARKNANDVAPAPQRRGLNVPCVDAPCKPALKSRQQGATSSASVNKRATGACKLAGMRLLIESGFKERTSQRLATLSSKRPRLKGKRRFRTCKRPAVQPVPGVA